MARTLVSAWQQRIVNGGTTPWPDFIGSVRGDRSAPPREGIAFWRGHDLFRVVDTWTAYVPAEQVSLVAVPPPGTAATVLLSRFCEAAGLPGRTAASAPAARRNVALGAAELEAIRRMNLAVEGRLNTSQHRFVIEAGIRSRLAGAGGRPLVLPAEHREWARAYGEQLVAEVERRGLHVVGELTDLVPRPGGSDAPAPDAVGDDELLVATEAALASLALDHGRLFRRFRRDVAAREGHLPSPAQLLGSRAAPAVSGSAGGRCAVPTATASRRGSATATSAASRARGGPADQTSVRPSLACRGGGSCCRATPAGRTCGRPRAPSSG